MLTISRVDDRFYAEVTGQRKLDIYTETGRKFFAKTDERLTFDVDARGRATQVTLLQNGKEMVAKRLR